MVGELPGPAVRGRDRVTRLMLLQPAPQIRVKADVEPVVGLRLQYINIVHGTNWFEPRIQAPPGAALNRVRNYTRRYNGPGERGGEAGAASRGERTPRPGFCMTWV